MKALLPFLAMLFAVGCGDVHSLGNLGDPLVIFGAQVEGQLPGQSSADRLRASVLWETQPQELLDCLEQAQTQEEVYACTVPKKFQPAQASTSVSIQPTFPASFNVPVYLLPDPIVLSGESGSLFGYGVLVVYEDGNGNQTLDLVPPEATHSDDTILASGIPTDENRVDFVIYREGELSPLWKLFEPFGCPEPLEGFSVLSSEYHPATGYECMLIPAHQATIRVHFEDSEELRQLICEPQPGASTYPSKPPPPDRKVKCHFHDSLEYVIDPTRYCKVSQVYQLAGCHAYFGCLEPDWNLLDDPPEWWPCTGESDNGFSIRDHPVVLTRAFDDLFIISYDSGDKKYPMNEIEVWLLYSSTEILVFVHPRAIRLIDNDEDAFLSPGDELIMFEPFATGWFTEAHSDVLFKLVLQHSIELEVIDTLAELVWLSPGY